jgi:hypothetical protein
MILSEETIDLLHPVDLGKLPMEEYQKFCLETGMVFRIMVDELGRDWAFMPFSYPDTYHKDQVGSALRGEVFDKGYLYEDFHNKN